MRYYGCKLKLLDYIDEAVSNLKLPEGASFFDIFSGTASVGKHFKRKGYKVISNDFLEFSYAIAKTYISLNEQPSFNSLKEYDKRLDNPSGVITYLNNINGLHDFITENYSPVGSASRQYFSTENALKIDAIRTKIHEWKSSEVITNDEYYYLITALIDAINLVSNVTGTYAAYLKTWDPRALNRMELKLPKIIKSNLNNSAVKGDANKIVAEYPVDILYLDPPYNSRQFASNYFLLELIAEGWFDNKPEIYGKTGMRPYEEQKSLYCRKSDASEALKDLVNNARSKYIVLSYNNEGIIPENDILKILSSKGNVEVFRKPHKRYRSINQDGSNSVTEELLFLVKSENFNG